MTLADHVFYEEYGVTLYQGDNADILPLLSPESIDVVVTSPPYNTGLVGNKSVKPSGFRKEHAMAKNLTKMTSGYSDTLPESEYQQQQVDMLNSLYRVLTPTGGVWYNHKVRWRNKEWIVPSDWIRRSQLRIRTEVIWDRGVSLVLNAKMPFPQDERMYWLIKSDAFSWNQSAVGLGTVWRIPPCNFKDHSCVFPEALVMNCLRCVAQPDSTVLDPCCGSGTVLSVARKLGYRVIGIERDPSYCSVVVDRLRQQPLPIFHTHTMQRTLDL